MSLDAQHQDAIDPAKVPKPKPKALGNPLKAKHKAKVQGKAQLKDLSNHELSVVCITISRINQVA